LRVPAKAGSIEQNWQSVRPKRMAHPTAAAGVRADFPSETEAKAEAKTQAAQVFAAKGWISRRSRYLIGGG